jgi:hypothetical protein
MDGNLYSSMEVGDVGYICEVAKLRKCNRRRQPARVDIEGKHLHLFNLYRDLRYTLNEIGKILIKCTDAWATANPPTLRDLACRLSAALAQDTPDAEAGDDDSASTSVTRSSRWSSQRRAGILQLPSLLLQSVSQLESLTVCSRRICLVGRHLAHT